MSLSVRPDPFVGSGRLYLVGVLRFGLRGVLHHASLFYMDTRYYVTAARVTVGTRINAESSTLEVIDKTRQVNGLYRIRTREVYGEESRRCAYLDVVPARHIFHVAAEVTAR